MSSRFPSRPYDPFPRSLRRGRLVWASEAPGADPAETFPSGRDRVVPLVLRREPFGPALDTPKPLLPVPKSAGSSPLEPQLKNSRSLTDPSGTSWETKHPAAARRETAPWIALERLGFSARVRRQLDVVPLVPRILSERSRSFPKSTCCRIAGTPPICPSPRRKFGGCPSHRPCGCTWLSPLEMVRAWSWRLELRLACLRSGAERGPSPRGIRLDISSRSRL